MPARIPSPGARDETASKARRLVADFTVRDGADDERACIEHVAQVHITQTGRRTDGAKISRAARLQDAQVIKAERLSTRSRAHVEQFGVGYLRIHLAKGAGLIQKRERGTARQAVRPQAQIQARLAHARRIGEGMAEKNAPSADRDKRAPRSS